MEVEEIFVILWGWGQRGKGKYNWHSAMELGMIMEDWIWRSRKTGRGLQSAYLQPFQERPVH